MSLTKLTTLQRLRLAAQGLDSHGRESETIQPGILPTPRAAAPLESSNRNIPRSHPLEHYLLSVSERVDGDNEAFEALRQELPATLFALMYRYNALICLGIHLPRV